MDIIQEAKEWLEVTDKYGFQGDSEAAIDLISRLVDRLEAPQEPQLIQEIINIEDTSGIILDMAALNKTLDNIPPPFRQDYAKRIATYLKYALPPVGDK